MIFFKRYGRAGKDTHKKSQKDSAMAESFFDPHPSSPKYDNLNFE